MITKRCRFESFEGGYCLVSESNIRMAVFRPVGVARARVSPFAEQDLQGRLPLATAFVFILLVLRFFNRRRSETVVFFASSAPQWATKAIRKIRIWANLPEFRRKTSAQSLPFAQRAQIRRQARMEHTPMIEQR